MSKIIINGKTLQVEGQNFTIRNGVVTVDGKSLDQLIATDGQLVEPAAVYHVSVEGDVGAIEGDMVDVTVTGNAGDVRTMSGDINVGGDVAGKASTMSGDVIVRGSAKQAASMSGKVASREGDWLEPNQVRGGDKIIAVSGWGREVRFRVEPN